MAEHLAEHLGETTAELFTEAREARARVKATRERAAQAVAASRQAWNKRHSGALPSPSAARGTGSRGTLTSDAGSWTCPSPYTPMPSDALPAKVVALPRDGECSRAPLT